jgi:monothiol glutaredoxin
MNDELKKKINDLINSKKVFLFMKGNPSMPQCGFSAQVVEILQQANADFASFNILEDEEMRQGVKEYGNWPTYPQLYVDGKLVGGCDIVKQMFESGELNRLFKKD